MQVMGIDWATNQDAFMSLYAMMHELAADVVQLAAQFGAIFA